MVEACRDLVGSCAMLAQHSGGADSTASSAGSVARLVLDP